MRQTRVVDLLEQLSAAVTVLSRRRERVLVGIDGPDCAGKTTLADRLAGSLTTQSPPIQTVRVSLDGFHRPRRMRYQRGELSAAGYYADSFDYPTLSNECLLPFLGGASHVRTSTHDLLGDAAQDIDRTPVPTRAVLVVDGVFLLRAELRGLWTLSVYLRISPEESLRRAHRRDLELFGSVEEVDRRYLGRYLPGQDLYRQESSPESAAHILVDNERAEAPVILRQLTG